MCKLKRHLYNKARYFVSVLESKRPDMFEWLRKTCGKVEAYYDKDEQLINAVALSRGKYTFSELKKIKDTNPEHFNELRTQLLNN